MEKGASNVHVFVGADDYLAENAARAALYAVVPENIRATALEIVSGKASNAEEQLASLSACRASLDTPPFFDPVKATWWRGVDFLPGGGRGGKVSDAVAQALDKFVASLVAHPLPPNQHFVVTAPKLLKTSLIAKQLKQIAEIREFGVEAKAGRRLDAVRGMLPDLAASEGLTFEPDAAEAFVALVGADTRRIVSELAKLRTYLGAPKAKVTRADVAAITSPGGEMPEPWDLTDAVGARDARRFLGILTRYEGTSGYGVMLASMIEKLFRELVVVREAIDRKWMTPFGAWARNLAEDVRKDADAAGLGPGAGKSGYQMRRLADSAQKYTLNELRVARYRILDLREKLVSGGMEESALAPVLLRIMGTQRRRA